ncbi:hypothetical protein [Streptomyces sp. NBC_01235]|nr:hypothetical protein OG289_48670 [Streptomyces sp. NBC_01235]
MASRLVMPAIVSGIRSAAERGSCNLLPRTSAAVADLISRHDSPH